MRRRLLFILLFALAGISPLISATTSADDNGGNYRLYLTGIKVAPPTAPPPLNCEVDGTSYPTIPTYDEPDSRPDTLHADLNLSRRGYEPTGEHLGLVDYGGPTDSAAPQLPGLFSDQRTPTFRQNYRVYAWDWGCDCRGALLPHPSHPQEVWPVALIGVTTNRGEVIHLPNRRGGEIDGAGYKALVIYADESRVTLKYTRNDDVVSGYTIHIEGICVEPTLLATYRNADNAGRRDLPALYPFQAVGRATGGELRVAIRDTGIFMDPRSRKDWWVGRSPEWFETSDTLSVESSGINPITK